MNTSSSIDTLIEQIRQGFAATPRPPDAFLVGSHDGCEPEESVAPFRGLEWASLDAAMLDANYTALSFFSEGGLRYFTPAFLVADVRRQLRTADPAFHLTHGLCPFETTVEAGGRRWTRAYGGDSLLNPRRYRAISWRDHARFRLAVFCREEAVGIVAYLRWRADAVAEYSDCIRAALDSFWLERAAHAPTAAGLEAFVEHEQAYLRAVTGDLERGA